MYKAVVIIEHFGVFWERTEWEKRKEILTRAPIDDPGGHDTKYNKRVTEQQIPCDSPFMRYLE